ncbi:uncharacterized protein AC631_05986 [Debaryomyces fabryi]|uniref:JAB1/MPN/MOV34 metalloenzyme domain-containing protein n=1 Tax=Debaryomyces fabryi TaxID=58627 RepID=A0A0V1PQJ8_9ASCO|nr:uncharacterized protein AC631_05986 [Debaryomyces fabryi]KRZ98254.1 hypothetical protein AC631_05986 [Debaryomyces fabryi]CUM57058.1 unnamed protein product [Debaryomyces fabryi]
MSDISTVQLHSIALFNLSDHITRQEKSKFGILLGTTDKTTITVTTSFELLFDNDLDISTEFLKKRLDQFNAVLPQYTMVGFYQLINEQDPNSATLSVLRQLQDYQKRTSVQEKHLIFTLINMGKFHNAEGAEPFKSFLHENRSLPLRTSILANETENIATSTIVNHPNYFSSEISRDANDINNDFKLDKHNEELSVSVNQLHAKVESIIKYLQHRPKDNESKNLEQEIKTHNLIGHLSSKIVSFQRNHASGDHSVQLQATQLSLLTAQLLALDNLKSQIAKNIIRFSIHTNPQSIGPIRH